MQVNLPSVDRPIGDEAEKAFTLPSAFYLDPDVYEFEKEQIFFKSWQFIAHKSSLTNVGDFVVQHICGEPALVVRSDGDSLRGFINICPVGGHELLKNQSGTCAGDTLQCDHCERVYTLDGTGAGHGRQAAVALVSLRLELFCDCVFVNFDSDAVSLSQQAGDLESDIRKTVPFLDELRSPMANAFGNTNINAGWKVVVDNYVECYHCSPAHPDFASLINMDTYQVDTFELWSRQLGRDIRPKNSAYPFASDRGFQSSAFWFLWPNTTFNLLPGAREMSVFAIRPTGLASSSFEGYSLCADDEFDAQRAQYTAEVLAPEDTALCESVQRGLHSRAYDQGRIVVDDARSGIGEQGIHHFHRLVHRSLSEAARTTT